MKQTTATLVIIVLALLAGVPRTALSNPNRAEDPVRLVFLDPDTSSSHGALPVYTIVNDAARNEQYRQWMKNDAAEWALFLFRQAFLIANGETVPATYYVALIPDGNQADAGFCIREGRELRTYASTPYMKLAPEDWAFTSTFLHETGHVVLALLNGGKEVPKHPIAAISHSTAALTDRGTAFDEGFAIHLETLAARFCSDPVIRERYHHDRYLFGIPSVRSEYHRQAADLMTFAQTRSRYYDVAENCFAFSPAFRGGDYLRTQLDKSRDFSSLRDANQLLQSEGFTAGFFYAFLLRGKESVPVDTVRERQVRLLHALKSVFGAAAGNAEAPLLLDLVSVYSKEYPGERDGILDVLHELSHGVFIDPAASALWSRHYLGALRLERAERSTAKFDSALARWRNKAEEDPRALYARVGPQIRCEVPEVAVRLEAFPESQPLSFDINTAEEGTAASIPGISREEIRSWFAARANSPFAGPDDFRKRSGLTAETLARIKF